jgi:hypothetical protein
VTARTEKITETEYQLVLASYARGSAYVNSEVWLILETSIARRKSL